MGREFHTAAKQKAAELEADGDVDLGITLDGVEYVAYKPDETQIALFTAAFSKDSTSVEQVAAVLRLARGIFAKSDYIKLTERLNDRTDAFDTEKLMEILEYAIEEFANYPLERSSASTPSPTPAGRRSTARAPGKGSTRSASTRAASAT